METYEGMKRMMEEALGVYPQHMPAYEPFMINLMDDLCIRTTLLLLKESWKKTLKEFKMDDDIKRVNLILQDFPEIITFYEWENGVEEECAEDDKDVRSMALNVFGKFWEAAHNFFANPPHIFYEKSHAFFSKKLCMLRAYHYDLNVQNEIQMLFGFGKEERQWIQVDYWRNVYIQRLEEYFEEQPEAWRVCIAVNHKYFHEGMQKAMIPPSYNSEKERRYNDQKIVLLHLPDKVLREEGNDPLVEQEIENRECAKEILRDIALRWGF